jgi:hypothetical protein
MVIVLCRTVTMIGQTMVIDENIRNDAFGMAHETIAVRKILDEVVAKAERSLLEGDVWGTLHQRSLELVAADHLVQHQQMPRIDNVLVVPGRKSSPIGAPGLDAGQLIVRWRC